MVWYMIYWQISICVTQDEKDLPNKHIKYGVSVKIHYIQLVMTVIGTHSGGKANSLWGKNQQSQHIYQGILKGGNSSHSWFIILYRKSLWSNFRPSSRLPVACVSLRIAPQHNKPPWLGAKCLYYEEDLKCTQNSHFVMTHFVFMNKTCLESTRPL